MEKIKNENSLDFTANYNMYNVLGCTAGSKCSITDFGDNKDDAEDDVVAPTVSNVESDTEIEDVVEVAEPGDDNYYYGSSCNVEFNRLFAVLRSPEMKAAVKKAEKAIANGTATKGDYVTVVYGMIYYYAMMNYKKYNHCLVETMVSNAIDKIVEKAINAYDPAKGKFQTYAKLYVFQALREAKNHAFDIDEDYGKITRLSHKLSAQNGRKVYAEDIKNAIDDMNEKVTDEKKKWSLSVDKIKRNIMSIGVIRMDDSWHEVCSEDSTVDDDTDCNYGIQDLADALDHYCKDDDVPVVIDFICNTRSYIQLGRKYKVTNSAIGQKLRKIGALVSNSQDCKAKRIIRHFLDEYANLNNSHSA